MTDGRRGWATRPSSWPPRRGRRRAGGAAASTRTREASTELAASIERTSARADEPARTAGGGQHVGMSPPRRPRPTREELESARALTVPDVVADDLRLLIVGINPGLWTAWAGHHFARPGNRFWAALHAAGLTERVLDPSEERALLARGIGVTNMVPRATAAAAELTPQELRAGGARLRELVARHRVRAVAILGAGAYRTAFGRPRAGLGLQPDPLAGAAVWVIPNPSGLQARYGTEEIAGLLREAWATSDGPGMEGTPTSAA